MTTFASDLPDLKPIRSSVLGKRLTLGDPLAEPPPLDTPEVAAPSTGDQLDTFIHQNRLVTPKAALEARKVPRSSIAELNQTDADEIRTRLLAMGNRDTRSPAMKALDLLDAPRNVIMSLLNSDLRRKAEAEGDTGTFGLGRVNFSDVLRSLGVNNRVAAGILGFTGDVLFDPLTYVGPAGWGAKVGVQAGGKVSTVGLRAVGKRLLDKQIAHVASGGAGVLDEAAHGYLAAKAAQKGFASPQEWFTSLAGQGLKPSAIRDDIARTVYGDPSKSLLERVFRPLGGERSFERAAPKDAEIGNFAHDFFNSASATDPASMAARKFVEKYGEGTGAALRFGRSKGATGSQILHVPFLSQYTVQTGPFTAGATRALGNLKLAQRAQDAVHGLTGAASGVLEGIGDAHAALEQTILSNREAKAAESEAHAALMAQLPDDPPPPPSSPDLPGAGPIGPQPPSPSPIVPGMEGGLELPPNAPERTSNYIIDSAAATPEPRPEQGRIAFDVDARAQEILDNGDALDLEDARGMAQIEADAAARQAQQNIPPTTDTAGGLNTTTPSPTAGGLPGAGATGDANVLEEGRQGLLSPPDSSTTTPPAVQPTAGGFASHRERVLGEARSAFSDRPSEELDAFAALVDARAKAMVKSGKIKHGDELWSSFSIAKGADGKPNVLYAQAASPRGSIRWEDGHAVIRALKAPNVSTLFHETGHLFLPTLDTAEHAAIAKVYKVDAALLTMTSADAKKTPALFRKWAAAHERWANDFERYLASGKAPTPELQSVFEKLKQWFTDLYKKIIGTPLEKELSPEIRKVMDRMLGGVDDGGGLAVPAGKVTRSTIWDRLEKSVEDTRDIIRAQEESIEHGDELIGGRVGITNIAGATTFRSIPTELKMALQRPGGESLRRRFIRVVGQTRLKAGGEDAVVSEFGGDYEKYVDWLEGLAGSERAKVLRAAELSEKLGANPSAPFWRELWEAWPVKGRKADIAPMDALDVVKAGPDVAFTFHGKPLHTTLDEDGTLVVVFDTPSRSGMTVPVELVGEMPVDPGSVRRLSEDEIAAMQGVDDTNLYQRDVAGQEGLFGSRVGKIGDGREQASLFGPAPEEPKPIPVGEPERMLNESDDAYKARVAQHRKWAESARNTGTLFQGGPDPMLPGPEWKSPRQLEEERWTERAAQLDAEHRDALDQVRALRDRALKSLEAFDPETAVPNDATLNDVLRLGELKDRADHLLALEAHRSNWVDLSNKLDAADDPAFRTEELGDRLYNLAKSDPKAADSILEAIHGRMEALNAYAQSVQATIQSVADGPERDLADLAKHVLGTDDDSMAMALFAAPARFIRDRFGENTAAYRYADATERFWRRTFGVRRGSKTQVFADLKGELTTRPISEKLHAMHRMEQRVEAMRLPIPKADAMNLLHAYIYRETTDDARGLGPFVWKISEDGRNAGDSEMVEMLKRAQDSGALTPEHIALLKQNAKEFLAENRRIGFAEQDAGILGLLRPDYVSSPLTAEAQRAARAHKQAGNIGGAPSKGWPTPAFARARTTDQVRFPMAAENLGESSDRWHRFFVGDMALADAADESLTPIQLRAKQAVVEYFKAVETDPSFAVKYSPRPSDPLELNALEKEGRFQHLTGGAPLEEMKETDLATIYGLRMGQHQHAMAMRNLGDMIVRDGFQIDPELFAKSGQRPGAEGRLRGGTKVTVVTGLKSNLGNPVDGVKIGDTLYRRLDTSLWSAGDNVLGNMLSGLHTSGGAPVNMKSMLLHHAQADAIEDVLRLGEPSRFDELLRTADTLTGMWKMVTLTRPSWIVFNMLGDTANALARGADPRTLTDVTRGRQLWQVYKNRHAPEALKDLVVTLRDGREMTGIEFWNDVVNSRVVDNTLSSEAMLKIVENNPGLLATADRKMRSFVAPWFRINQAQQDWMRMMVFSSFLDQGHDTSVAAKRVLESIGDYADFTKTEERYFRRTFPFYSWMRNNLGYQIMQLGQRPSYAALMPKLQAALQEVAAGEAVVPENLRPGWMRDQLATQIGTDPNSRFSIMLGNALPTGDLTQALAGAFGTEGAMKFLHYFTSNLNPVATIPLQIGTGTEFFSGRSIGPDSYTGDMSVRQFAVDQATGPLAEAGKVVKAFGRGTGQGVARALLGGRVQAFDQPRLDSSVRREFREAEQRIRGAVSRAQRDGDEETSKQARTRLMQLYADAMRRGLDDIVPAWAEEQLAEMGEAG